MAMTAIALFVSAAVTWGGYEQVSFIMTAISHAILATIFAAMAWSLRTYKTRHSLLAYVLGCVMAMANSSVSAAGSNAPGLGIVAGVVVIISMAMAVGNGMRFLPDCHTSMTEAGLCGRDTCTKVPEEVSNHVHHGSSKYTYGLSHPASWASRSVRSIFLM